MRHLALLFFLSLSFLNILKAQINYEASFEEAKKLSFETNKPLAILLHVQPLAESTVSTDALQNNKVIDLLNNKFINFKVNSEDSVEICEFLTQYKIVHLPSYLFLDTKGGLLFSEMAHLYSPEPIINMLHKAYQMAFNEKSLVEYDSLYNTGSKDNHFLKDYILRRQKSGLTQNEELVEKYIQGLRVSDLNDYKEVLFIMKTGPIVDSYSYKLAYLNTEIIDSIFSTEPLADRIAINQEIIRNTMNNAIANKDVKQARAAANFFMKSWSTDPARGRSEQNLVMLDYYKAVGDTSSYLIFASSYYNREIMSLPIEELKERDSLKFEEAKNTAIRQTTNIIIDDSTSQRTVSYSIGISKNFSATRLNNAAWTFYELAKRNEDYLLTAMKWIRRALEMSPKPEFYDTYAHLLYSLSFYNEAISMQRNALKMSNSDQGRSQYYQDELRKMETRTL